MDHLTLAALDHIVIKGSVGEGQELVLRGHRRVVYAPGEHDVADPDEPSGEETNRRKTGQAQHEGRDGEGDLVGVLERVVLRAELTEDEDDREFEHDRHDDAPGAEHRLDEQTDDGRHG